VTAGAPPTLVNGVPVAHTRPDPRPERDRGVLMAAEPADVTGPDPLVAEGTKKAGLVWIATPGSDRSRPAWQHWSGQAAYVLTGDGEQPLPELLLAERATVTVPSKDTRGRLVSWVAAVSRVAPDTDEWRQVTPALAALRLNARDGETQVERWAGSAVVLRLAPTGEIVEGPGQLPDGSGAAPPLPSPATTCGRRPFLLGRRRSARR
jgi:hypothetical protein